MHLNCDQKKAKCDKTTTANEKSIFPERNFSLLAASCNPMHVYNYSRNVIYSAYHNTIKAKESAAEQREKIGHLPVLMESPIFHSDKLAGPTHRERERIRGEGEREKTRKERGKKRKRESREKGRESKREGGRAREKEGQREAKCHYNDEMQDEGLKGTNGVPVLILQVKLVLNSCA